MDGIGVPLVTPFTQDGTLDESAVRDLVGWLQTRGVEFLVPCGSTSEAPFLTAAERRRVIEAVVDVADVPVLAGTGHPGFAATRAATADAAVAGADAALVVTPFYYDHDQATLAAYYEDLADEADVPVFLYSVPAFTGTGLQPDTVARLATHPNVAGMKDSSGDLEEFARIQQRTADADFDLLVGNGSVLAAAVAAGADGGVLALANVAPSATSDVYARAAAGDHEAASARNAELVELNHAITSRYGVPGLKAALRYRGVPAGYPRRPHRPVDESVEATLADLVDATPLA